MLPDLVIAAVCKSKSGEPIPLVEQRTIRQTGRIKRPPASLGPLADAVAPSV